jgi:hypothetical protein
MACPYYENNKNISDWLDSNKGKCFIGYVPFTPFLKEASSIFELPDPKIDRYYKILTLNKTFFSSKKFEGSLLFISACHGIQYSYNMETFGNEQVIIAPNNWDLIIDNDKYAYDFFKCMLGIDPDDLNNIRSIPPMSVVDAFNKSMPPALPLYEIKIKSLYDGGQNTYLPGEVNIEVKN